MKYKIKYNQVGGAGIKINKMLNYIDEKKTGFMQAFNDLQLDGNQKNEIKRKAYVKEEIDKHINDLNNNKYKLINSFIEFQNNVEDHITQGLPCNLISKKKELCKTSWNWGYASNNNAIAINLDPYQLTFQERNKINYFTIMNKNNNLIILSLEQMPDNTNNFFIQTPNDIFSSNVLKKDINNNNSSSNIEKATLFKINTPFESNKFEIKLKEPKITKPQSLVYPVSSSTPQQIQKIVNSSSQMQKKENALSTLGNPVSSSTPQQIQKIGNPVSSKIPQLEANKNKAVSSKAKEGKEFIHTDKKYMTLDFYYNEGLHDNIIYYIYNNDNLELSNSNENEIILKYNYGQEERHPLSLLSINGKNYYYFDVLKSNFTEAKISEKLFCLKNDRNIINREETKNLSDVTNQINEEVKKEQDKTIPLQKNKMKSEEKPIKSGYKMTAVNKYLRDAKVVFHLLNLSTTSISSKSIDDKVAPFSSSKI